MFSVALVCLECVQTLSCMAPNSKNTILINHRKYFKTYAKKIGREKNCGKDVFQMKEDQQPNVAFALEIIM